MSVQEIQRHIDYLARLYVELTDPAVKEDVLDDIVFFWQLLREAK